MGHPCHREGFNLGNGREQGIGKAKAAHVFHAHRIQEPPQVIAFMLDHPGMKSFDRPVDRLPIQVKALITHGGIARYGTTQAGQGQAALPILHGRAQPE